MKKTLEHNKFKSEKDYYEFVNYVKEKHNENEISTEEMEAILEMAKNEESDRRRTERNALNILINKEPIKEGEEGYYTQMIYDILNEKYYNCEYNLYDLKKAKTCGFNPCLTILVENNTQNELDSVCKLIIDDIKNNALDLRNVTGEELNKKYIERV